MKSNNRNTLQVENAQVLSHDGFPGEQFVIKLLAPETAKKAKAGMFVHLQCDESVPMRRPLSIMRSHKTEGWIEVLYRTFGSGTKKLSAQGRGNNLSLIGPIGKPFVIDTNKSRPLLIGGGVGIPPMIFLCDTLLSEHKSTKFSPLVLMGSETPFPFSPKPSEILVPDLPDGVIAAMPLLEDWGIASRLASLQDFPGCFSGYVTDLARYWLENMNDHQRSQVEIFVCGPHVMLEAAAKIAKEFSLPCQISLEEYMACAVGGCAGCVVEIKTDQGPVMKRVCVDGPVFEASEVF